MKDNIIDVSESSKDSEYAQKSPKILDILVKESGKETHNIGKTIVKTKKVFICEWCLYPKKKLMRCSFKKCKIKICKDCSTFILSKPFCHSHVAEIVRNKTTLILVKGDV